MKNTFRITIWIVFAITILSTLVVAQTTQEIQDYSMNSELYREIQRQKLEKLTNDLVGDGLLTPEQAASIMNANPDAPLVLDLSQEVPKAQPTQLPPPPVEQNNFAQEEAERFRQFEVERAGTQVPTFAETLKYLTENEQVLLAHRNNYYKAFLQLAENPNELYRRNIEWHTYTPKQQQRILNRIGKGWPLESAFRPANHLTSAVGIGYEVSDALKFQDAFVKQEKVVINAGEAVMSTGESAVNIVQGDYDLGDVLHLLSVGILLGIGVVICLYIYRRSKKQQAKPN